MTYGVIASQKLSMLLEEKGMLSEEAYRITQEASHIAMDNGWHLRTIVLNSAHGCAHPILALVEAGKLTTEEVESVFDWSEWVKQEPYIYERAGLGAA
jgi:adenylosuccinate lyase